MNGGMWELSLYADKQILAGLKAGKTLCCDRRDEPLLPWLLDHPDIANSGIVQVSDQSSHIKFWWKGDTQK